MTYDTLASDQVLEKTISALGERNFKALTVPTGTEALKKLQELIPAGSSVINGSSTTLEQIGFIEYLKGGAHGWNNLHEKILAEKDPAKQALLRKQMTVADYYIGSIHAVSEEGDFVIASNTGSQLAPIVFNAKNLIFVVGTQKIMPTLADAMARLREYVLPLENARIRGLYGRDTTFSKVLIYEREAESSGRTIQIVFVKEKLGF